jgi:hypothetical protein
MAGYSVASLALMLFITGVAGATAGQTVTSISVVDIGGNSPLVGRVGYVSASTGTTLDANGSAEIGTWRYRCSYLGGKGKGSQNSHFCTFVHTLSGEGTITASGGLGTNSLTTRWLAITGATGTYKGAFGTARLKNFSGETTPFTFYLIR